MLISTFDYLVNSVFLLKRFLKEQLFKFLPFRIWCLQYRNYAKVSLLFLWNLTSSSYGGRKKKGCDNTLPPEKLTISSESGMQKYPGVHGDLAGVPRADGISLPVPPGLLGCSAGALPAKLAWILTGAF